MNATAVNIKNNVISIALVSVNQTHFFNPFLYIPILTKQSVQNRFKFSVAKKEAADFTPLLN